MWGALILDRSYGTQEFRESAWSERRVRRPGGPALALAMLNLDDSVRHGRYVPMGAGTPTTEKASRLLKAPAGGGCGGGNQGREGRQDRDLQTHAAHNGLL